MVYTSLPPYLDPPNWNKQQPSTQQQPLQGARTAAAATSDACVQQQRMLPPRMDGSSVEAGTVRPNSMAERARLARLPQPEQALKCPRCESTNTKFCYYNNYSLSQPRHFCKACRRYWTRGGALRNVPVGGGCRRNKRGKSNGSKQASGTDIKAAGPSRATASGGCSIGVIRADLTAPPQLPFQLPSLPEFGSGNVGFSYCGTTVDPVHDLAATGSSLVFEPWRLTQLHQLPFFNGFESAAVQRPPSSLGYHLFGGEGAGNNSHPSQGLKIDPSLPPGMKLERQFMGINGSSDTYWQDRSGASSHGPGAGSVGNSGVASHWTDLSGFDSSSAQILL